MSIQEKLFNIQQELHAPKDQHNSFGKYNYRSCEGILEAVKPLLNKHKCNLLLTDEMREVGGRVYVEARATLHETDGVEIVAVTACARESETRKGMDDAQITGATSSYARKYALNGLFAIDDTKDSDATNTHGKDMADKVTDEAPPFNKSKNGKVISEKQRKMIYAKSKAKEIPEDDMKAFLNDCLGIDSSKKILMDDMDKVLAFIENWGPKIGMDKIIEIENFLKSLDGEAQKKFHVELAKMGFNGIEEIKENKLEEVKLIVDTILNGGE